MELKDEAHIDETALVQELLFSLLVVLKRQINKVNTNWSVLNSNKNPTIFGKFLRTIFSKE